MTLCTAILALYILALILFPHKMAYAMGYIIGLVIGLEIGVPLACAFRWGR
jgi:uncharacterized protein YebE (UPF0316 family)